MSELFLPHVCVGLAYSAVALLVWWVVDDWHDAAVGKLLTSSPGTSQRIVSTEPQALPIVAPLAKPELAPRGLPLG